jgi:hypothetical protein
MEGAKFPINIFDSSIHILSTAIFFKPDAVSLITSSVSASCSFGFFAIRP